MSYRNTREASMCAKVGPGLKRKHVKTVSITSYLAIAQCCPPIDVKDEGRLDGVRSDEAAKKAEISSLL